MTLEQFIQFTSTSKFGKELKTVTIGETSITAVLATAMNDISVEVEFQPQYIAATDMDTMRFVAQNVINRLYQRIIQVAVA